MRRPTIKDVAELAQVSLKTVSRVINDEPSVQARTRERVQQAIADLGYQPDPSARSLRSAQSYAIGLLYDNPNPYYVIAVQNGVLSVCRETGYGLQIHPCDSTSPRLAREIIDLVQQRAPRRHRAGAADVGTAGTGQRTAGARHPSGADRVRCGRPTGRQRLHLRRRPRRGVRDHRIPDPARPQPHRLPVGRQVARLLVGALQGLRRRAARLRHRAGRGPGGRGRLLVR